MESMRRKPRIVKQCKVCGREFSVSPCRKDSAKYCSKQCSAKASKGRNFVRCRECGAEFHKKESKAKKNVWGHFCGRECLSKAQSRMNSGSSNPNFKGRNFDSDGYRLYIPHGGYDETGKTIKLHKKVVQDLFGVGSMPSGIHIHHRDCDILNNTPKNLQVMTPSDHKWLHKQFGVATLAAIERGELDYQTAAKWSDDQLRAEALLALDARDQSILYGAIMRFTGKAPDIGVLAAIKPVRVTFTEVEELTQTARGSGGFGSTGQ